MKSKVLLFFCFLLLCSQAQALICNGIAPAKIEDINLTPGHTYHFSFTVYNTTPDANQSCDAGTFSTELKVHNSDANLEDLVDWSFNFQDQEPNENVFLGADQTTKLLVSVTPKQSSGKNSFMLSVSRLPDQGMMGVINSASVIIVANFTSSFEENDYISLPFWFEFKNCPDGSIMRIEEVCPKKIKLDTASDSTPLTGNGTNEPGPAPLPNLADYGWVIILLIVIIILGFAFYTLKQKQSTKGDSNWGLG